MPEHSGQVVAFGECMVELRAGPDGRIEVGYGGDTLNTAQHLAELGVATAYLTAIGSDPLSARMKRAWDAVGIDTRLVATVEGACVGLYAIDVDEHGERSFSYWRSHSAARSLFDTTDIDTLLAAAASADWLYLSGITLSLFDAAGRDRIGVLAKAVREHGGRVAFDPNYRPAGWASPDAAIAAFASLAPQIAIVLPSLDDERKLFGGDAAACFDRWQAWGAGEAIVKDGGNGAYVRQNGTTLTVPPPRVLRPLDTTGAGDAFNAGFLAAHLGGAPADMAAAAGHERAAQAVMRRGALAAIL